MIAIKGLSYRYPGADDWALRDIDLSIGEGELVALAGPSGGGKSTLALAIGGYLQPHTGGAWRGTVRVNGRQVGQVPTYEVADVVALVQQNPENQFCTLTVDDEVAFGLENLRVDPAEIARRVSWALDVVGAAHLRGRDLASLSGGEKQRVAIAAMLAARPRVLILDEPTSNLDPSATRAAFAVLERLRRTSGLTLVIIEHKLGYLRHLRPRLVRIEDGRLTADGGALPDPQPIAAREPAAVGEPIVSAEGLTHAFNGRPALLEVTATLRAGELVAVMGDNGSGKSTLLRCFMGLIRPQGGTLRVLGDASPTPSVSGRARDAGFLFQNPDHQLLGATVWDDATLLARNLGLLAQATSRAERLLAEAGLDAKREEHPFRLSYGQKRRLNLVAALAHAPRLVLADEVLIGQDSAHAAAVMQFLRSTADGGACVVLALHDPETALRYADRVLFLDAGRLVAQGPPRTVLAEVAAQGRPAYGVC